MSLQDEIKLAKALISDGIHCHSEMEVFTAWKIVEFWVFYVDIKGDYFGAFSGRNSSFIFTYTLLSINIFPSWAIFPINPPVCLVTSSCFKNTQLKEMGYPAALPTAAPLS